MKTREFIILFALCLTASRLCAQTGVIAHRGFWNTDGSAQNSLTSLIKADSIGCYGSEFDVWLSKDNVLVVNHDVVYKMKGMETTKSAKLTKLRLSNNETLPLLEAYLATGTDCSTKLVLELKPHRKKKRETKAVEKIVSMVKDMNLESRMEYITFSEHAMKEFIRLAPKGTPVYYLNGDLSPQELLEVGAAGLDYNLKTLKKHSDWIGQAHQLGLKVNVWTVDNAEDMLWFIAQGVDYITTNEPVLLQQLLNQYKEHTP